jgi:AraC-like DNA-binding protein
MESVPWDAIWTAGSIEDKTACIDSMLGQHWQPFSHPFLQRAIDRFAADTTLTTASLAAELGISRKTLHQHFEQYLGIAPSLYRKINRFRNAVREKLEGGQVYTLTELAHSMEFFDQSHMIRDFRSLTGFIPSAYFRKIRTMENSSIQWMMR